MTVFGCHAFLFWNSSQNNYGYAAAQNSHECGCMMRSIGNGVAKAPPNPGMSGQPKFGAQFFNMPEGCAKI